MTRLLTPSRLLLIAAALAAGVVAPLIFPAYQLQLTELLLFIVFALAWDLVGGQMGYNSFGNVLFFFSHQKAIRQLLAYAPPGTSA